MTQRKLLLRRPIHNISLFDTPLNNELKHEVMYWLMDGKSLCSLNLVSKSWYHAVQSFNKWFDTSVALYKTLIHEYSPESTYYTNAVDILLVGMKELSLNPIVTVTDLNRFKNFIGRSLTNIAPRWSNIINLIRDTRLVQMRSIMTFSFGSSTHNYHVSMLTDTLDDTTPTMRCYIYLLLSQLDILWRTPREYVKRLCGEGDALALKNYHPRDCHITFYGENGDHYYTVNCVNKSNGFVYTYYSKGAPEGYKMEEEEEGKIYTNKCIYNKIISVTTFIGTLFEKFIPDKVIKELMESDKWEKSKYHGMMPESIKDEWKRRGEYGTGHHHNLENYHQGKEYEQDSIEFKQFKQFEKDHVLGKLIPYRAEWFIYDLDIAIVGAIDHVYQDVEAGKKDGKIHLVMVDYKVVENLWKGSYNGDGGCAPPTINTADCNFIHYSIQQCLYKYILEHNYNVIVDRCYLLQLHEKIPKYNLEPVLYLESFMKSLIDYRKMQL